MSDRLRWLAPIPAVLCCLLSVFSLAQDLHGGAPRIDEPRAQAALAGDSVRVRLPLAALPEQRLIAKAWLLSPRGETSADLTEDVAPGSKSIQLVLSRPRDKRGRIIEGIEWYRVGYRLEAPSGAAVHGILALGAITTNLFHLSLAGPSEYITPGTSLSLRVYAGNPVTRRAVRGVRVTAQLEIDVPGKKKAQTVTRTKVVDHSGESLFAFPIPDITGVSASLHLTGELRGAGSETATSTLDSDFEALDQAYISLEKDKVLYKPGQTVHLRALVFDGRSHAAANTPLTLTINDPSGKKVLAEALTTNRFGIAPCDWVLSPHTETGNYSIQVEPGNASVLDGTGFMTVRVEQYDLPEFTVTASLDRGYYLEGQTPEIKIHAAYLFGKPLSGGTVRLVPDPDEDSRFNTGNRKNQIDAGEKSTLNRDGDAIFHPNVTQAFRAFRAEAYLRFRDLTFRAYVTDPTTGRTEPRKFSLRISHQPIHIYLRELGGNNREADYLVITSYADGAPVACKVTLDAVSKNSPPARMAIVQTSRYGLGKVHLRYSTVQNGYPSIDLRIAAEDAKGTIGKFDDSLNSYAQPDTIWIEAAKSLLAPLEPIQATVHGPSGKLVDVDVIGEGAMLAHQQVVLHDGRANVTIPADERFHGSIDLVAYSIRDPASRQYGDNSEIAVLYPQDTDLRVEVSGMKRTYAPGDNVQAGLRVTDPRGAVSAAIGIGVTDTAVDERARAEEEFGQPSWGWGAWYEENQEISGLTLDDLNRTNMSKPVPGDLQLVAQALLAQSYHNDVSVQSEDDSDARNEYESSMSTALKPLGTVLLNFKPDHLTSNLSTIREVAARAKLAGTILVDPWNVPYRARVHTERDDEVLEFESSGPDKKFGTDDDFAVEVARQSVFARTGERLQAMLQSALDRNQQLPGSASALFAFAARRGLNLAAVHDPKGRPFTYQVHIERRWLSVTVHMASEGESPDSPEYGFEPPVWTSPMFNYFAAASAKLHEALRSWIAAGHPFPVTEEEARQAFSAVGIQVDNLRDPTGKPFSVKAEEVLAYTQLQNVHAGASISANSKPVTIRMRAVEILRSPTEGNSREPELVDEFVEPYQQQSGADLQPKTMESGTFRADTGAVGGTVTDQTGAVIPGATIIVKSGATNNETSAKSDAAGRFVVGNLQPGYYSVEVSALGFTTMSLRGVEVSSAALTTVDVTLSVGTMSETVAVTAPPPPAVATAAVTVSADVRNPATSRTVLRPAGSATIIPPTLTPRVRHVFEETAYWAPSLETDASGRAAFHFTVPDSLTTWKLHAVVSTVDGRTEQLSSNFITFQPFFVDLETPQVLTAGDELTLPVNLRNYTRNAETLSASIAGQAWMESLTANVVHATVPAQGSTAVHFGLRAVHSTDDGHLRISAANSVVGDAVEKSVRVHPDGEPRTLAASVLLHDNQNLLQLNLPQSVIAGSLHARLRIYPNLATHIAESMDALIAQPHGCAEQIISSAYPSLLLLRLARQTGTHSALSDRAQQYLQQADEELLDDYDVSGGLTYWGGSDRRPDAALTAYSLEFLIDATPFTSVRASTISAARAWLLSTQQSDGSWTAHYGSPDPRSALYIALQLQRSLPADASGAERDRTRLAVDRALAWAQTFVSAVHDPYSNAMRLDIAVLRNQPAEQQRLVSELIATIHHDAQRTYWQVESGLPFYTWGYAASLETSALVAHSLLATTLTAADRAAVDSAIQYLVENEDAGGLWDSGQTTVRVLQALLPFAAAQLKSSSPDAPLTVRINGVPLSQSDSAVLRENSRILDAPRTLDVTSYLKPGANEIQFSSGSSSLFASAQISTAFYVPWAQQKNPGVRAGTDYGLEFNYHCQTAKASVGNPIPCEVQEKRFGASGYGMLLAEVGLPPGAEVDREQLAHLQAGGAIGRYEIAPDHIVFYTWTSDPAGIHFNFQFTPRYPIQAKAAPSVLYDYYNPDERVVLAPQLFEVPQQSR